MSKGSNGKLALLDTLSERNNGKISVLLYRSLMHTNQHLYTTALTTHHFQRIMLFPPSLKEHITLSPIKMT